MSRNDTPTLLDVIDLSVRRHLDGLFTAFPARVKEYSVATQKCDADPQIHHTFIGADGERISEVMPRLTDVPVMFPRGGGFGVTFPIQTGDYVLIVVSQFSLGLWLTNAQKGDPGNLTQYSLAGAIALPGLYPDPNALVDLADATNMKLGSDEGMQITITDSQVQVGGSSDAAALASKVNELLTAYNAHTHPHGDPVTGPTASTVTGTSTSTVLKLAS